MDSGLFVIAIILFTIGGILKFFEPQIKGWVGENFVNRKLNNLDPKYYKILNDLLLPSQGSIANTQIDHVVVSNFGIFCIETKDYRGWIFGSSYQEYWTQVIYSYKKKFYNPMRQNYTHIKAIESLIHDQYPNVPVYGFVAFPSADKLKISGTDVVGNTRDTIIKIKEYHREVITNEQRDKIYNILSQANISNKDLRKIHKSDVRAIKKR